MNGLLSVPQTIFTKASMHKAKPTVKMRSPMTPEPLTVLSKNLSMTIPTIAVTIGARSKASQKLPVQTIIW